MNKDGKRAGADLFEGLSASERAALARDLILSLEEAGLEQDAAAAWADEIEARSEAVHRGQFVARPWEESLERGRRIVAERRSP
jgi:putative addiction module component (TIGR02574 family)